MTRLHFAVLTTLCLIAPVVSAQVMRVHPVALICEQSAEPSVTVSRDGDFVVTWQARLENGRTALNFRKINATGTPNIGGEIARGKGWFANWADFPSLTVLDNGNWLAFWLQRSGAGYAYDIRMTRSTDEGASWAPSFVLHDDGTLSEHGFVSMVPVGDGDARVAWLDGRHTVAAGDNQDKHMHGHGHGAMTLRSAIVSRDGTGSSEEIDGRVCDCCQTDAARAGQDVLLVYRDRDADEIRDVQLVRHDGNRWSSPMAIFDEGWRIAGCPVNGPSIAVHGNNVIVAGYSEAGSTPTVRVRTSNDGGRAWHDVVVIANGDTLGRLDTAALPDGRFILSRFDVAGENARLQLSLLNRVGTLIEMQTIAELPAGRLIGFPRMAVIKDTALVAWTQPETSGPQVRLARIEIDPTEAAESVEDAARSRPSP